jgi:integrase
MAVKDRGDGKYDVELRGRHVKRVCDMRPRPNDADMLEQSGKRLLALGKPLQDVIAELRGGGTITAPRFAQYAEKWVAAQRVNAHSKTVYANALKRAEPVIGRLTLDQIDLTAFKRVIGHMDGYSSQSVRQTITVIKSVLNDAVDEGVIPTRPPSRIKSLPRVEQVRPGFAITREQHQAIVAAAPLRYRALFDVWPWLGCRIGEVIGLEWDDWNGSTILLMRQVRIDGTVGPLKGKKRIAKVNARTIDVPDIAQRILADWRQSNPLPLMFPAPHGGHIKRADLIAACSKAGTDAGIDGFHSHIFRHTAGSWMLEAGAPVPYVAARLGHTPQMLMRTYAHEIESANRRGAAIVNRWANGDGEGTAEAPSEKQPPSPAAEGDTR